jgi:(p)ppGpp synthase/HD superfamily hydrolase
MSTLERAVSIAVDAHRGQRDRVGQPYLLHPIRVMLRMESTDDQIVAVLHDVVERSDWTFDRLRDEGFSARIVDAIDSLTRRDEEAYEEYILRVSTNRIGRRVKLADLRDKCDRIDLEKPAEDGEERLSRFRRAMAVLEARGDAD